MTGRRYAEPDDACGYSCGGKATGTTTAGGAQVRVCRACAALAGADFHPDGPAGRVGSDRGLRRASDPRITDPRVLPGRIEEVGPLAEIDATNAVLVDGVTAARVATLNSDGGGRGVALQLQGRVNKTRDRASVVFLLDEQGLALLVGQCLSMVGRMPDDEGQRLIDRIDAALDAALPPEQPQQPPAQEGHRQP